MAPQLGNAQHGFLNGRSTVSQLLCFLHELGCALDKGLQSDVIHLNFNKALDSVNHVLLVKSYWIDGSVHRERVSIVMVRGRFEEIG